MIRPALAVGLGIGWGLLASAGGVWACPKVTGILQRPGQAEDEFQRVLLEISDLCQGMFFDTGYDRAQARIHATRALELWNDLYQHYYLAPPEAFREHPRWREIMDSISGPLKRIQRYAWEEAFFRGHHQLRVLQDTLTEFYGEPPPRRPAELGPLVHTLETLQYIPEGGAEEDLERRARLRLLRDRFQSWMQRWPDQERAEKAFAPFHQELEKLELAVAAGRAQEIGLRTRALLDQTRPMIRDALALEWTLGNQASLTKTP